MILNIDAMNGADSKKSLAMFHATKLMAINKRYPKPNDPILVRRLSVFRKTKEQPQRNITKIKSRPISTIALLDVNSTPLPEIV